SPIDVSSGTIVSEASGLANTDSYAVFLSKQPTGDVKIDLGNADGQVTINGKLPDPVTKGADTLTFGTSNWTQPQFVSVAAVNDSLKEGTHYGRITHKIQAASLN